MHREKDHFTTKIKEGLRKWFLLGLDEEYGSNYTALSEYNPALAKDNLSMLEGACAPSLFLFFFITVVGYAFHDIAPVYFSMILPELIGLLAIALILKLRPFQISDVALSYLTSILFNITWYIYVIGYDIFMPSDFSFTMVCLAVLLLTSLLNAHPKDNIVTFVIFLLLYAVTEHLFSPSTPSFTQFCCVFISGAIGISISQRNTRMNIRNKLINDMYKTYGKASILVAQIDLLHNKFLTLQCPDYMEIALSAGDVAKETVLHISQYFVSPEYQNDFLHFFALKPFRNAWQKTNSSISIFWISGRNGASLLLSSSPAPTKRHLRSLQLSAI